MCSAHVSVDTNARDAPNYGVSLWTRSPVLHLCAGPGGGDGGADVMLDMCVCPYIPAACT